MPEDQHSLADAEPFSILQEMALVACQPAPIDQDTAGRFVVFDPIVAVCLVVNDLKCERILPSNLHICQES